MGLRDRKADRHAERRGGGGVTTYRMRQKLLSIGDDYWIENGDGERVFKVDGKALRFRDTLMLQDADGHDLMKIQERKINLRDTMRIEDAGGATVATVKKGLFTPLRARFDVDVEGGDDLDVQGNVVDHEYTISRGHDRVAEVSKRWFRVADTYGVEVEPGQDPLLVLAVAVVVDSMAHDVG